MSKEEKIRKTLVVDTQTIWDKTVEKASKLIMLTEQGDVFFKINKANMTNKEIVLLYMIGKKFALEGNLVETEEANLDELSEFIGINKQNIAARISELKNEQKIKLVNRGHYVLQSYIIEKTVNQLIDKYSKQIEE